MDHAKRHPCALTNLIKTWHCPSQHQTLQPYVTSSRQQSRCSSPRREEDTTLLSTSLSVAARRLRHFASMTSVMMPDVFIQSCETAHENCVSRPSNGAGKLCRGTPTATKTVLRHSEPDEDNNRTHADDPIVFMTTTYGLAERVAAKERRPCDHCNYPYSYTRTHQGDSAVQIC